MKIPINREIKIVLLQWLKQGVINTDDFNRLNGNSNNGFVDLINKGDEMYTEEDLNSVPDDLIIKVADYIQEARYKREMANKLNK